jgi:hypothetical protein
MPCDRWLYLDICSLCTVNRVQGCIISQNGELPILNACKCRAEVHLQHKVNSLKKKKKNIHRFFQAKS